MKIPIHQQVFNWISFFLIIILFLGAILDAISNSVSLFTPNVTYFGTLIVIILAIVTHFSIRKYPVEWVMFGQKIRIKRLKEILTTTIAILVLLWIPRIGDLFQESEDRKETETRGYLIPAYDANPPNPCKEDNIPEDAMLIYLGNSLAYSTSEFMDIITSNNEKLLSVTATEDGIFINAILRDKDGKGIVKIENNKFIINPNNYWYQKRPDKHTLEVYDQFNQRVLYIRYLNQNAIKVLGIFYPSDRSTPIIKVEEETQQIFSNIKTSGDCIGKLRMLSFTLTVPANVANIMLKKAGNKSVDNSNTKP